MAWFCWMLFKDKKTIYITQERAGPSQHHSYLLGLPLNTSRWVLSFRGEFTERSRLGDYLTLSTIQTQMTLWASYDRHYTAILGWSSSPCLTLGLHELPLYFLRYGCNLQILTTNKHNWVGVKEIVIPRIQIQWSTRIVFSRVIWNKTWHLKNFCYYKMFPVAHTLLLLEYC